MRGILIAVAASLALAAPTARADEPKVDVGAAIRALAAPDPAARKKAAEDLGRSYPEGTRGVPALVEARRDEDASVRSAVDEALRVLAERAFLEVAKFIRDESALDACPDLGAATVLRGMGSRADSFDLAFVLKPRTR